MNPLTYMTETDLQSQLCSWKNLCLAYSHAARGKRGRGTTATFELRLTDNLLELQEALRNTTYQPGGYHS